MSNLKDFEREAATRRRRMVPRVPPADDLKTAGGDVENDHLNAYDTSDYNKNDTSVNDCLLPKTYSKELRSVSWEYENDQISSENESHGSPLKEQVVIAEPKETMLTIALQVFVPFLIAGFGTVGAGLVLDVVQVSEFM